MSVLTGSAGRARQRRAGVFAPARLRAAGSCVFPSVPQKVERDQRLTEMLKRAGGFEAAQIGWGKAETGDQVCDFLARFRIISRQEQHALAACLDRFGGQNSCGESIEGLYQLRTWEKIATISEDRRPPRSRGLKAGKSIAFVASTMVRPFQSAFLSAISGTAS